MSGCRSKRPLSFNWNAGRLGAKSGGNTDRDRCDFKFRKVYIFEREYRLIFFMSSMKFYFNSPKFSSGNVYTQKEQLVLLTYFLKFN